MPVVWLPLWGWLLWVLRSTWRVTTLPQYCPVASDCSCAPDILECCAFVHIYTCAHFPCGFLQDCHLLNVSAAICCKFMVICLICKQDTVSAGSYMGYKHYVWAHWLLAGHQNVKQTDVLPRENLWVSRLHHAGTPTQISFLSCQFRHVRRTPGVSESCWPTRKLYYNFESNPTTRSSNNS